MLLALPFYWMFNEVLLLRERIVFVLLSKYHTWDLYELGVFNTTSLPIRSMYLLDFITVWMWKSVSTLSPHYVFISPFFNSAGSLLSKTTSHCWLRPPCFFLTSTLVFSLSCPPATVITYPLSFSKKRPLKWKSWNHRELVLAVVRLLPLI